MDTIESQILIVENLREMIDILQQYTSKQPDSDLK
jgi:hypothetical protein